MFWGAAPRLERNDGERGLRARPVAASFGKRWARARRADPECANGFVEVLEIAVAEVLTESIHLVGQLVARRSACDRLARLRQTGQTGRQFLMSGRAGDRLARAGQCGQPSRQVYACPVEVAPVAPGCRRVDAGAKVEMLTFRDADVQRGNKSVHFPSGIDGVGHGLETRHETVAKALHHNAVTAREDHTSNFADEVGPSANGERLVLSHKPHGLHEVDQQHDRLLSDKSNAFIPIVRMLGPGGLLFLAHAITVDVDWLSA
jgi:hypothetical protein